MGTLREWLARIWGAMRRRRTDADLEQELQLHRALAEEAARRRGHGDGEARRMAGVDAGGVSQALDALRDQRGLPWIDDFCRDVVYTLKTLVRARGFAVTTIAILALGIGANTAIFSIIDAVVLRRLPVANPGELVLLTNPAIGGAAGGLRLGERDHVTFAEFETLRERMTSFSGMLAAGSFLPTYQARIDGQEEDVKVRLVSGEYFTVLGVPAAAGRVFTARGRSAEAFDARLRIADAELAIVGVAPSWFFGETVGEAPDVWVPAVMQPQIMPGSDWVRRGNIMWLHAIGRLAPGMTLARAQAEADVVFAQMLRELSQRVNPRIAKDVLQQHLVLRVADRGVSPLRGSYRVPLYILMGLVALVLLVACTSVATLLLARASARTKEFDIRLAVGAGRFRLFRQLFTESLVLSAIAGLAGMAFAFAIVRLLVATVVGGEDGPVVGVTLVDLGVRPDLRVWLFTAGVCFLTVMTFGLVPSWQAARAHVRLRSRVRHRFVFRRSTGAGLGHALVTWQVAMSVVLLMGAGWFVRTFRNLDTVDLGYTRRIAQLGVNFRPAGYELSDLPDAFDRVRERLTAVPGVRSVSYSQPGLLGDNYIPVRVEGVEVSNPADTLVKLVGVGPGYFSSLGIPIMRGRDLDRRDGPDSARVCVVNEAFASFFFPGEDPIGRVVFQGDDRFEIVGVSRDVRDTMTYPMSFAANLRGVVPRTFYPLAVQHGETGAFGMVYQLVTNDDPASVLQPAREAVTAVNPAIVISRAQPLGEQIGSRIHQERIMAQLAAVIGGVAVLLACVGLYGLLSHLVTRRTNEIGIRVALGAQRREVEAMVLRDMSLLVVAGLVIGVPISLASAGLVRSQLFGLTPTDPSTLVGVALLTFVVATIAGYLPARRAARINPLVAIRVE